MVINCCEKANIGPCMDVKAYKGRLFAIQNGRGYPGGRLCILRPDFSVISTFVGIGNARQIEIVNDVAFITARDDGLFILDISTDTPKLLCQYKTVEFATGIALYGNLAFVSCRLYGVQILDVSNPREPVQISIMQCGEVQSATAKDGILYCGAWGNMEVSIVDVRDPQKPQLLSKIPLQGQGDGVFVKDKILYAATGHCRRGYAHIEDPTDPMYGSGNGLECFDVSDPSNPQRINGVFFDRAMDGGVDFWEVSQYGETLLVNNSIVGVYGLDPKTLEQKFRVLVPKGADGNNKPVTGTTVIGNDIFISSVVDLFAVRQMDVGEQQPNDGSFKIETKPRQLTCTGSGASVEIVHKGTFPVLSLAQTDTHIVLACCEGGVHVLDKQTLKCCNVIRTNAPALEVKIHGNRLYVAHGKDGMSVYEIDGCRTCELGRLKEAFVYQMAISKSGKYLMAVSGSVLKMYNVENPQEIRTLYTCPPKIGVLYGNNLASNCLDDGTMIALWHARGLVYSNPDKGDNRFFEVNYTSKNGRFCFASGEGVETDGKHIFYVRGKRYILLSTQDASGTLVEDLPSSCLITGCHGVLTIQGDRALVAGRKSGEVLLLNIKDIQKPEVLVHLETTGVVSKALFAGERIFIPAERDGLLELKIN